jgi:hypothetical protein
MHRLHIFERPVANPVRFGTQLVDESGFWLFGEVNENKPAPGIEVDAVE